MNGKKYDSGKPRWELLPLAPIEEVVRVLTYGAETYEDENWRRVENGENRYYAAAMRHIVAWRLDGKNDQESGLHHLAHAICCLIFLVEREKGDG